MLGILPLQNCLYDLSIVYNILVYISQSKLLMYSECVVSMCVVCYIYRDNSHRPLMKQYNERVLNGL